MNEFQLIHPNEWMDYELIDSGRNEKLERFGPYIVSRPEPQACWNKTLNDEQWLEMAHARYIKTDKKDPSPEMGKWIVQKKMSDNWFVDYKHEQMQMRFRLALTSFKHVGLFPEQADNWNYIYDSLRQMELPETKTLNLFAYTGGATLAVLSAGSEVVHVESVKQVINWARENMEASHMDGVRWMFDDVMKYVKRELNRGKKYNCIILDPPASGRGPDGERWVLEKNINDLMKYCAQLLDSKKGVIVLNLYSMGLSALVADNLVNSYFTRITTKELGEFYFPDRSGKRLPLGTFLRMRNF